VRGEIRGNDISFTLQDDGDALRLDVGFSGRYLPEKDQIAGKLHRVWELSKGGGVRLEAEVIFTREPGR
jgi:hypothetical protein